MYGQMQFGYNRLVQKQRSAATIGIVGSVVGIVVAVAGYNSTPLLVTGATVASLSYAYACLSEIRESDWLNLVNTYNKSTFKKKIKISIQPLIASQITGGVMSLQLRF